MSPVPTFEGAPEPFRILDGASVGCADAAAMLEVLREAFGRWPAFPLPVSPLQHLRWKLEGPGGRGSGITLTVVEGQLAGVVINLERTYLVRGEPWRVLDPVDTSIHPRYQGQGLYRARQHFEAAHVDRLFDAQVSYSNNPAVVKVGQQHPINVEHPLENGPHLLVRVQRPVREARRAREVAGWRGVAQVVAATTAGGLSRLGGRRRKAREGLRLREVDAFDERVEGWFTLTARAFDFIQGRSARSLNWRHADPRSGRSRILLAEEGEALVGYATWRQAEGRAQLLDLLTLPGRLDAAVALLDGALAEVREADRVTAWLPRRHPQRALFASRGFVDTRRTPGLMTRALRRPESELAFLRSPGARVHVVLGDSDLA